MDHLQQLHQMCLQELQQLQRNIDHYLHSSGKMLSILSDCWQTVSDDNTFALLAYDRFMSSLSNMMDLARKFNLHLHVNKMDEEHSGRTLFAALRLNGSYNMQSCHGMRGKMNGLKAIEGVKEETKERPEFLSKKVVVECVKQHEQQELPTSHKNVKNEQNQEQIQIDPEQSLPKQGLIKETEHLHEHVQKLEKSRPLEVDNYEYDYMTHSIPPIEENEEDVNSSALSNSFSPTFRYPERDLAVYEAGCLLKASISYLQDLQSLRFYACDTESEDMVRIAALQHMLQLRQYTGLPTENEIFGLVVDNIILRAIRKEQSEFAQPAEDVASQGKRKVLLLDFGEVLEMSATDVTYHLPLQLQQIPAQAMCCELRGVEGKLEEKSVLQRRLQQLEYEQALFRVEEVQEHMLLLQLVEEEQGVDKAVKKKTTAANKKKHNVQKQDEKNKLKISATTKTASASSHSNPSEWPSTNPFLVDVTKTSCDNDEAIPLAALPRKPLLYLAKSDDKMLPNGLTFDELEMLEEEPLNTSNAMVAVMGHNPKDDERLCRFYDPKTGGCFKGSRCRQEHSPLLREGWTKDRLPAATIVDNHQPSVRYGRGIVINITPTYINGLEHFYAQINDPKKPMEPLIWNPDEIAQQQRLRRPPLLFELVLARYEDGLWYRARVEECDELNKKFKVFYVDYGNHQFVPLYDLARCDAATARLSFQATLCRLADIVRNTEATPAQNKNGIKLLNKLILNKSFDVKVLSHHEELLVQFLGDHFGQIPNTLIAKGYARPYKLMVA